MKYLLVAVSFLVRSVCLFANDRRWTVSSTVQQRPEPAMWVLSPALDLGLALVVAINLWVLILQEDTLFGLSPGGVKHGEYEAIPLEDR